jgi:uncharacterized membrane protein
MTTSGNIIGTPAALKPGVGSSYGNGWKMLWPHFLVLFLIGLIYFVIVMAFSGPQMLVNANGNPNSFSGISVLLSLLGIVYNMLIVTPVAYGMNYAYLKAARNEKAEIQDMFEAFKTYWNVVGAAVLTSLIILAGIILLIVPGIIFSCKLAFVPFLVVEKKMGVTEAINKSWNMTNGHAGQVFLIALLGIPIVIAGFICLGVGIIIAIMWIQMASASLYYAVSKERELESGAEIIQTPAVPPPGASPIQPA